MRVKNSYYTFSKHYPKGYMFDRRKHKKSKKPLLRAVGLCLAFVLIVTATFFAVDLGLKISYAPMGSGGTSQTSDVSDNAAIKQNGLKALYMPYSKLGSEDYIKSLIKKIKRSDANSVVIDFKTDEGKLCYSSLGEIAIAGKASIFDNDTVRRALSLFEQADITVAAKISCFRDPTAAEAVPEIAVKYMDTDVSWLDGSDERGGKPWLNPYSSKATKYITQVVSELRDMGINCFLLSSVQFPEGNSIAGATYPYEKNEEGRNAALKSFISKVRKAGDGNTMLFLWQDASDALVGDSIYFGKMNDADVDGIIYDMAERPDSYVIDKKTDYVSILGLYSSLNKLSGEKMSVYVTESEDYSFSYRRALGKNGYTNFVLRDVDGEY